MAMFGFGKKKEEETKMPTCACNSGVAEEKEESECCCGNEKTDESGCGCGAETKEEAGCSCANETPAESACCCGSGEVIQSIKVLGAGCKSCHEQYENAKAAVSDMGLSVEVEYITDMEKVMSYGVMSMPALVVNEKIVCTGKVLKLADVENLLHKIGF